MELEIFASKDNRYSRIYKTLTGFQVEDFMISDNNAFNIDSLILKGS